MTLRDANLKPGDKFDLIRRVEVQSIRDDDGHADLLSTSQIVYGLDKEYWRAENIERAPKLPDFWPPQDGDVWKHGKDWETYYPVANGKMHSVMMPGMSWTFDELTGIDEFELVFRAGVTDKDNKATTQRVIDLSKQVVNQKDQIRALSDEILELEESNSNLTNEMLDLNDDLVAARSAAKDACKEADAYLKELQTVSKRLQFRLHYWTAGGPSVWMEITNDYGEARGNLELNRDVHDVSEIEFRIVDAGTPRSWEPAESGR